jgi:hypothetical protein
MDSGMVSKIQKAVRYADERDRVRFSRFDVVFRGDHAVYSVGYDDGQWKCGCRFFSQRGVCSHTMAMERILAGMLPEGDTSD